MFNQNRIYRVFRLLNYLRAKPSKSPRALAGLLEISERSVYRYFDLINDLGFEVKKTESGRFFIEVNADDRIPFTSQEIQYLTTLLHSVGKKNNLAAVVLQKIGQYSEHQVAANNIYNVSLSRIIEQLDVAMQEKKQVVLVKYYSARSESISDRLVEPMQFTDNFEAISAFEVGSRQNKYFNLDRISEVLVLDSQMQFESQHKFFEPDIFGFQGKEMNKEVEFEMTLRACLLLKEEYPLANSFINTLPGSNQYVFKAKVQAYEGPARFVMGFRNEITVTGSEGFLEFLRSFTG